MTFSLNIIISTKVIYNTKYYTHHHTHLLSHYLSFWVCVRAVSYTHLDVYKRQVLHPAGFLQLFSNLYPILGTWDQ